MGTRRYTFADETNELHDQLERWGTFLLANLLWTICSLPLVTLPAATAGLFAVMSARARGTSIDLLSTFFGAARQLWLKASLLMLINAAIVACIALNLTIFQRMELSHPAALLSLSVTLFVGIMLLLANLYGWSLLVLVDMPLKAVISGALQLVFAYPLWSIGVLVAAVLPALCGLLLPQGIFVIALASVCTRIVTAGTWRVIQKHLLRDTILSF